MSTPTVALEPAPDGVFLPVRAQPGSRKHGVVGVHDGRLKVAVTQVAEKGKANDAIVEVLAKSLQLKGSQISLVSGSTNPLKRFLVTGVSLDQLAAKISAALPSRNSPATGR